MENALELLRGARTLIARPENWCQSWYAVGRNKSEWEIVVEPNDPRAERFCSLGALRNQLGIGVTQTLRGEHPLYEEAVTALAGTMRMKVPDFNDSRSHAEVLDAFDRAIARLEKQTEGAPLEPIETPELVLA